MQTIYAKNQFLPADTVFITADDRSFRFGDGIFETMLVVGGRMWDAAAHYARLAEGLAFFRLTLDVSNLPSICEELTAKNNLQSGYVRIIVSRGDSAGIVGYMPSDTPAYMVVQTVEKPFPAYKPLSLVVSSHTASLHIPCKVNSAMLYTLSMMQARDAECDNALILDAHGHICETASGNIFWVKDGVIYTPETSLPFIRGTVRNRVITLSPVPVREGRYTLADIAAADEIFMTNIGTLVAPVSDIRHSAGRIVPPQNLEDSVTKKIRALIEADINAS